MPVRHSPPRSLAQRIMLSFALLVTFVAGFYAFALYHPKSRTGWLYNQPVPYFLRVAAR